MTRLVTCLAAVCIVLNFSLCTGFVGRCDFPRVQKRSTIEVAMNTDQVPVSPTSGRQAALKRGVFGFGSVLSVALLRRERAVALELPECSDSVTIFRREKDNREVRTVSTNIPRYL